jgi:membrane-bound lytic murein transglycosylase D
MNKFRKNSIYLFLSVFITFFSTALSLASDTGTNAPEIKIAKVGEISGETITIAEASQEKISTFALPPEAKPDMAAKEDTAVIKNAPEVDNNPVVPLGISYKNNETAVKAIERNVTLYKDRIKERFSIWLERSARYIEIMKDVLREKGMPEDLVFLPFVESGFNNNAYSSARAAGPWQFIESTGKRYGLIIDWWRDERKDPVKSTEAAAGYLKDLYKMFGSWKLALAAYNAGEGRIQKALKRSGAEDYWALLGTKQIKPETKEYVPRYIAAAMIANTPEDFGFINLAYHQPLQYDVVNISSPMDISAIAKCAETTIEKIREFNPELRRWSTPPDADSYALRLPKDSAAIFMENLNNMPENERFTVDIYKAKKGDNLKTIAKRSGVPVSAILAMNSMSGIESIKAGHELKVPPKGMYQADIHDRMTAKKEAKKALKKVAKKESSAKVVSKKKSLKTAKIKSDKPVSTKVSVKKSKSSVKAKRT